MPHLKLTEKTKRRSLPIFLYGRVDRIFCNARITKNIVPNRTKRDNKYNGHSYSCPGELSGCCVYHSEITVRQKS